MSGFRVEAFAASDVGQTRTGNEDNFLKGRFVFAVADGMGGHQAGEIASEQALLPVAAVDGAQLDGVEATTAALVEAIKDANRSVVRQSTENPQLRGMGTTLTAVAVRDGRLHVAHVGDSRAYLLRQGELSQLTEDHTLVEQLVREGRLSRDQISSHPQRSVITRAIGVDREVEVDTLIEELQPGDQILLCSDGLTGPVGDEAIAGILTTQTHGDDAVDALIAAANEAGGPDNITVVLLRVVDAAGAFTGAAPVADDQDETQDLGAAAAPPGTVQQIRTREESGEDWAQAFGRYGGQQGTDDATKGPHQASRRRRWPRVLAGLLGLLVLLGIIGAGGWLIVSRAFFVGVVDGEVAILRGLNQEVAGVALFSVEEVSDVAVDDLSAPVQRALAEGIPIASVAEGERLVERYREEVAEAEIDDEPVTDPTASPTGSPTETASPS